MDTAIFRASTADNNTDGLRPAPVWEIPEVRPLLAMLEPGEAIEFDAPQLDIAVAVLEGVGQVWVDDRIRTVRAGDVAVVPSAPHRGIRAGVVRLLVFHAAVPAPSDPTYVKDGVARPLGLWETPANTRPRGDRMRELPDPGDGSDEVRQLEQNEVKEQARRAISSLRARFQRGAEERTPRSDAEFESIVGAVLELSRTLTFDHEAIMDMVETVNREAAGLGETRSRELRRSIDRLTAATRLQIEKEEAAVLPLMTVLTPGGSDV